MRLFRKPFLWILLSGLTIPSNNRANDSLFGEEILVPTGKVRMKVMLVRVPLTTASELLLGDDREIDYWDLVMPPLLQGGKAEVIERSFVEGAATMELKQDWTSKHQLAAYSSVALAGEKPELAEDLLKKGAVEVGAGLRWKGLITQTSAAAAATEWELEWVAPDIQARLMDTWPAVGGLKPELLMRRSVELAQRSRVMPWSRAALLAAQMEPGPAGEVHRGKVMLLFGRIEKGAALDHASHPLRLDETAPVGGIWVFTLPAAEFQSWNLSRLSPLQDEEAFRGWLHRIGTDGIRLESLAAGSGTCIIGGRREWACARRYRAPAEGAASGDRPMPSEGLEMEQMDHLFSMTDGSVRCEWPWKPETWTRLPLELLPDVRTTALELPAINRERFESWAHPLRDAPELLRAWTTQDGHVRACFARRARPSAAAIKKREPRSIQNTWCIDTPLEPWSASLGKLGPGTQAAIAEDLVASLRNGKVDLVDGMTCTVTRGHVNSDGHAGSAFTSYADTLSLHPRPDGGTLIPHSTQEDTAYMDWSSDWQPDGSLISHEWRTQPTPRLWKVRTPAMPESQAEKSGITLHVYERSTLQASTDLRDGELCVLAATRLPPTHRGRKTIRWWVARQLPVENTAAPRPAARRYVRAEVKDKLGALLEQTVVAINDQIETVVSRGTELQFIEPRADVSESRLVIDAIKEAPLQPSWQIREQAVGTLLSVESSEWSLTRDMNPPRLIEDRFLHHEKAGSPIEVAVHRPVFDLRAATGPLPKPGQSETTELGPDAVVTITLVP